MTVQVDSGGYLRPAVLRWVSLQEHLRERHACALSRRLWKLREVCFWTHLYSWPLFGNAPPGRIMGASCVLHWRRWYCGHLPVGLGKCVCLLTGNRYRELDLPSDFGFVRTSWPRASEHDRNNR